MGNKKRGRRSRKPLTWKSSYEGALSVLSIWGTRSFSCKNEDDKLHPHRCIPSDATAVGTHYMSSDSSKEGERTRKRCWLCSSPPAPPSCQRVGTEVLSDRECAGFDYPPKICSFCCWDKSNLWRNSCIKQHCSDKREYSEEGEGTACTSSWLLPLLCSCHYTCRKLTVTDSEASSAASPPPSQSQEQPSLLHPSPLISSLFLSSIR